MNVPSGHRCDALLTYDASPFLVQPEADQLSSARQGVHHFQTVTVFEVAFPCRVERGRRRQELAYVAGLVTSVCFCVEPLICLGLPSVSLVSPVIRGEYPMPRSFRDGSIALLIHRAPLARMPAGKHHFHIRLPDG